MSKKKLSSLVIGSAFWRVAKTGADNILTFFTFVILARHLNPAEFGAFAIASFFVAISRTIASGGMGDVLIREENPDEELKNTIFWANMGLSVLFSALLMGVSPLIAGAAGDANIRWPLVALAATLLVGPLTSINRAMASRDFAIKQLELIALTGSVLGSIASITTAILGGGLWALVAGSLVNSLVDLTLVRRAFPWRPKAQFSWPRYKAIFSFSSNMLGAQLMQQMVIRIQEVILSTMLTLTAVGLYRIGTRFMELISQAFVSPVSSLALIALSKVRHDPDRWASGYLRMVGVTSMIYCPIILGFAAVAPDAVPLVFGEKWIPSVRVVQILSVLCPATVLAYFYGPTLSAAGRSDLLRNITLTQFVLTVLFCIAGAQFGITGVAIAFVLRSYLTLPMQLRWQNQGTGLPTGKALAVVAKPFAAGLVMALAIGAAQPFLQVHVPNIVLRLAVSISGGATIYFGIMFTLFRSLTLSELATAQQMLATAKAKFAR